MQTLEEVKNFYNTYTTRRFGNPWLKTPGFDEGRIREIESSLDVQLPRIYRSLLSNYNWGQRLELPLIDFNGDPTGIIFGNSKEAHPFYEFLRSNGLLEIGTFNDHDRICVSLADTETADQVFNLPYDGTTDPPDVADMRLVGRDLEQVIIIATNIFKLVQDAGGSEIIDDWSGVFEMLSTHISLFKTYYQELRSTRPGWYPEGVEPPEMPPPPSTEWVR